MPKESKIDKILTEVLDMKSKMFTKDEFDKFKKDEFQPLNSNVEKLATRVNKFLDEDYVFNLKRISRVEYRTKKVLGEKVDKVDAEFEEQYQGEAELRKAEAEG